MSQERTSVSKEGLGSLTSCLMEGNADEEKGARKARRRALIASIIVQILVLATLVMYPLLSHGERLAVTYITPTIPYSHPGEPVRLMGNNSPQGDTPTVCRFCLLFRNRPTIVTVNHGNPTSDANEPGGTLIPGVQPGIYIHGTQPIAGPDKGPEPPREPQPPAKKAANQSWPYRSSRT